jgi:FkbM family methyltransferase
MTRGGCGYHKVRRVGLSWNLRPSDEVDRDLFWFGNKEAGDWRLCRSLLSPGDTILDVGCNFGYYALTFARALRRQCLIHAFEPNPPTYRRLCEHIQMNRMRCIRAHGVGLGLEDAVFDMHSSSENSGAAYLVAPGSASVAGHISVTSLDKFALAHGIRRIDFIKVDIEGHECFFLDGAKETLGRIGPPMMMEIHPEALARNGHVPGDLFGRLRELGYREFYYRRVNVLLPYDEQAFEGGYIYHNVFCFRERSHGGSVDPMATR